MKAPVLIQYLQTIYPECFIVFVMVFKSISHGSTFLTSVHAGEHEAQSSHGPVWRWHVDSVHAEFDQCFSIYAWQLLREQEALQTAQHAVIDDGGSGVLAGWHHHATQLKDRDSGSTSTIYFMHTKNSRNANSLWVCLRIMEVCYCECLFFSHPPITWYIRFFHPQSSSCYVTHSHTACLPV